jgi:hypothetical protein|tara:strand:- start:344 stop:1054 length:711 start_codon:yes stop_codon:yes gene_type:complete
MNQHCGGKWLKIGNESTLNPFYEDIAARRYNYAPGKDLSACRLVFLKDVLKDPRNKTLVRNGRFIWCRNLKYEGRESSGLRRVSFTVDKGQKRFLVREDNVLSIPSKTFINNNRYFRHKDTTFRAFSSVFGYTNTMTMMLQNTDLDRNDFEQMVKDDNPHKPGTLVAPRLGYFYPTANGAGLPPSEAWDTEHPYGIIIGPSFNNNDYAGREFYRVKFGATTYERVHPIELEIINEV